MQQPKVTIGLPVYNGDNHLEDCLDSLLGQTYSNFEIIILDNASTDRTPEICREYAARDSRISYRRQERNVGAAANFNDAFLHASGEYFKWAAHDDICSPEFIETCVDILKLNPEIVLAFTATELINDDGSVVIYDPLTGAYVDKGGQPWTLYFEPALFSDDPIVRFRAILMRSIICHEIFGLIRTEALKRTSLIGGYYGSDKVLLAELCLQGRFEQANDNLFFRRCHTGQSSKMPLIEKERWISGKDPGRFVFPQKKVLKGYLLALFKTQLSMTQKARGIAALWHYVMRPDKLKRLNMASKSSYLRINKIDKNRKPDSISV